jgi:hypothetical protein
VKERHGKDVNIKLFGKPVVPWWAAMGASAPLPGLLGAMSAHVSVSVFLDDLVDAMQTRMMWERFRL